MTSDSMLINHPKGKENTYIRPLMLAKKKQKKECSFLCCCQHIFGRQILWQQRVQRPRGSFP